MPGALADRVVATETALTLRHAVSRTPPPAATVSVTGLRWSAGRLRLRLAWKRLPRRTALTAVAYERPLPGGAWTQPAALALFEDASGTGARRIAAPAPRVCRPTAVRVDVFLDGARVLTRRRARRGADVLRRLDGRAAGVAWQRRAVAHHGPLPLKGLERSLHRDRLEPAVVADRVVQDGDQQQRRVITATTDPINMACATRLAAVGEEQHEHEDHGRDEEQHDPQRVRDHPDRAVDAVAARLLTVRAKSSHLS